jgi:hypothetical protein
MSGGITVVDIVEDVVTVVVVVVVPMHMSWYDGFDQPVVPWPNKMWSLGTCSAHPWRAILVTGAPNVAAIVGYALMSRQVVSSGTSNRSALKQLIPASRIVIEAALSCVVVVVVPMHMLPFPGV